MYVGGIFIDAENYPLVGAGFTFTILAIIFVALRLVARGWIVRSVGIDDGLIVIAALGTLGFLIACMEQIRFGLGTAVDEKTLTRFIQATVASVISYTITHLAVKLSIAFQCLRIFVTPNARRLFIAIIVFLCVYGVVCLLMTIITCWPVAKYWDDSIPGKCMDSRVLRYAFAGVNIVNDIVLLCAPIPFLRSLQMPRRVKFLLAGLFLCGGVACIIAIIRLYSLWVYSSVTIPERPIQGVAIAIWSSLECNIAIMCACVPALKPLFNKTFPGLAGSYARSSKQPNAGQYPRSGRARDYDNISNKAHEGEDVFPGDGGAGITVKRSFELNSIAVNDNDSERNLVDGKPIGGRSGVFTVEARTS